MWFFFTYARFQIKISSPSQTTASDSQHFWGRISNSFFQCNNYIDQKLLDVRAFFAFLLFGLTILFLYQTRGSQLMHVVLIVLSMAPTYILLVSILDSINVFLFITITVIILSIHFSW